MRVALIGYGWVGKAMHKLFPTAYIYDRDVENSKKYVNECDVAFIGVPTPNREFDDTYASTDDVGGGYPSGEMELDISIVEECVAWCECPLIVIRSTVNPGTTDYLSKKYNKHIIMQPEYLGETPNHPLLDTKNTQFLILGGKKEDTRKLIELYATVYNANTSIRQVSAIEAEIIKLSENRAIVFKVAQCQELYDVCEKAGIDYYEIRDAVYRDDPRFNLWWSFIFPDKRGFNSKCVPKDIYAWCAWAESCGYTPKITRAILEKNKEWIASNK